MDPQRLYFILDEWMWESPAKVIPHPHQIADVLTELLKRPDQEAISHIVKACRAYTVADAD